MRLPSFRRPPSARALCAGLAVAWLAAGCFTPDASRRRAATAEPAIVFLHGLGGSPSDWLDLADGLGRDHRVVLEGLPGHAHHVMPDSLPLERGADHVRAALRRLPGPVVIVAHSVGGEVAVRVALAEPDRVTGLVLVETALRPQFSPAERAGLERALAHDFAGTVDGIYAAFGADSAQGDDLVRQEHAVGPRAFRIWLREVLHDDLSARAAALRVPVLLVLSPRSWPPGEPWPATARALGYERVARVTPVRIGRSAHFVMLDQPGALEATIRAWLARRPAR